MAIAIDLILPDKAMQPPDSGRLTNKCRDIKDVLVDRRTRRRCAGISRRNVFFCFLCVFFLIFFISSLDLRQRLLVNPVVRLTGECLCRFYGLRRVSAQILRTQVSAA